MVRFASTFRRMVFPYSDKAGRILQSILNLQGKWGI
ncbi:hypothetical protein PATA110616_21890 [Paenibacillus tarimensis]